MYMNNDIVATCNNLFKNNNDFHNFILKAIKKEHLNVPEIFELRIVQEVAKQYLK